MEVFERMAAMGHEQIAFGFDADAGYRGIIAIHSTLRGPALGGTRFWNYESEEAAIIDVLRLARGMTYKAAMADLELGGGKAVIIGDPRRADRESLFRAHGRFIDTLGGRYITAEDVNTSVSDMDHVQKETRYVTGVHDGSGDPSPVTAYGTYQGIRACAQERWGDPSLEGRHVAVQGVGHVGYHLCKYLAAEGARLTVTDIEASRVARVVDEFGADSVGPDEIYDVDADIFAPCALGSTINDQTLPRLGFEIVAGSANNQLAEERHGDALHERGILYAPDYVINAGGLINVYGELKHWTREQSHQHAERIFDTLVQVFELARARSIPTYQAADELAEQRLESSRQARRSRASDRETTGEAVGTGR